MPVLALDRRRVRGRRDAREVDAEQRAERTRGPVAVSTGYTEVGREFDLIRPANEYGPMQMEIQLIF